MRACDVAVNLRHPTAGETSGTVIRLLGLGKPLIVNETGSFAEIPDDCCAKVPLDDTEEDLLLAYLRALAADEPLRRRMGENARRHMELHHGLAGSARGYADFLRETVEAGARAVPRRPAARRLSGGRPALRSRPRGQRRDGGPRGGGGGGRPAARDRGGDRGGGPGPLRKGVIASSRIQRPRQVGPHHPGPLTPGLPLLTGEEGEVSLDTRYPAATRLTCNPGSGSRSPSREGGRSRREAPAGVVGPSGVMGFSSPPGGGTLWIQLLAAVRPTYSGIRQRARVHARAGQWYLPAPCVGSFGSRFR